MDRGQIIATLAPLYRMACDTYTQLGTLAKEAAQEGDTPAFKAINRRAVNKSHFLDGIKAAVVALGIADADFMEIVNQDQPVKDGSGGKEDMECKLC